MSKPKILIQLDTDPQPSVFDAVVAIDAGVDQLLRHGGVTVEEVRDLVYGGIFTRSPDDLKSTAIFIGGSNVAAAEEILAQVRGTFFGPLRISVLLDANGANTTAAAAVLAAEKHMPLAGARALVLAATGPVGSRVVRLLAGRGASVRVGSRDLTRAEEVCRGVSQRNAGADVSPSFVTNENELKTALEGVRLVIAAGPPGVKLLPANIRRDCRSLEVGVDLNAVPPLGIEGVEVTDRAQARDAIIAYGAIGVGALKMKAHKRAIQRLFESSNQILDAEQVLELAAQVSASSGGASGKL
jgi:methylenetetrahydrofolate/methylenetetrahydromethanopterin dehydrogenase (NADP+)